MKSRKEIIEGLRELADDYEKTAHNCERICHYYIEKGNLEDSESANAQSWAWARAADDLRDFIECIE